ncbi:2-oxo-4-hydroxy-4-carboxy-5-ureidoimidazoline decarboxylase [Nocardioides sp.]|uniref:2-oxo-4-hydroxy-4-carboxy-5-ureidoimidazoline decarboxylase n=1 Tax=Nocardioides sp. TaxID=35761 RepID=UPI00286E3E8C|nr:2-oxo-4-hydroxy-4-carboxy-5-ureidoimidazoline decarboxylase [Nocardioides sp.]
MGSPDVAAFNVMDDDEARSRLLACLDVPRWADEVLAGRPYERLDQLDDKLTEAACALSDEELERALARHPRIGERADAAKHDATLSTHEQSGVDREDADIVRQLEDGNRAYEQRFGRVFIIRAAGRSAREILDELRLRLDNSDERERAETINQLTQIALLRNREALSR